MLCIWAPTDLNILEAVLYDPVKVCSNWKTIQSTVLITVLVNFRNHCLEACLRRYNDLFNLKLKWSFPCYTPQVGSYRQYKVFKDWFIKILWRVGIAVLNLYMWCMLTIDRYSSKNNYKYIISACSHSTFARKYYLEDISFITIVLKLICKWYFANQFSRIWARKLIF